MAKKLEKVNKTITGLELKYEVLLVYIVSILGFIFSFLKNEVSEDAKFHYRQAGATFIIYTGFAIISSILTALSIPLAIATLGIVSVLIWILNVSMWLIEVTVVVFVVITIIKAFHNEKYEIPFVSNIAKAVWKK